MSSETLLYLNHHTLIGNVAKRGYNAWHYRADLQGAEPNHYDGAIPIDDVIRRLFTFKAVEMPVFVGITDDEGNIIRYAEQDDRKAIVRDDNHHVMGVFKSGYTPHQFQDILLTKVANIIDDNQLVIDSAGVLRKGAIAWVAVSMPDNVETSAGFPIRPYLLATSSHDGSLSTTYKQVYNAPVCDNTLFAGLAENGKQFKARHTSGSDMKIESIRQALDIMFTMTDNIVAEIERLSNISVSDAEWDAIVNRLVPVGEEGEVSNRSISMAQTKQGLIRNLYANDPMVTPWSGTALGVVQAFNTFTHHVQGSDKNRAERNAMNALNGRIQESDASVLAVVNELVLV